MMEGAKDVEKAEECKKARPDNNEDCTNESKSGLSSGRSSRCNKALKLLESQGIIAGKTLGSGSYAKVKSAYDINKKHKVAVKIIDKKKNYDEYLGKFLPREMEAMKTLSNHYALVKFYQIIETTSRFFFVMELADKGDLLTTIKAETFISEKQAGIWFVHLHDGIKYMHSKGVVHRDIKCENLVIDSKNTLKIADFGFAKKIGKMKNGSPLLSETYCGSYAYAPPEILKGTPYDPEISDVWSMGVVLFTMVYGRLPFDDSDHKRLLKQVQSRVLFPTKPEVSEKCRILIIKVLSKCTDRVPLRNIHADPWFKKHNEIIQLANAKKEAKTLNPGTVEVESSSANKLKVPPQQGTIERVVSGKGSERSDTSSRQCYSLAKKTGGSSR